VERAERRRERIGPVNPLAEQEHAQMSERAQFLAEQRDDMEAAVAQLEEVISSLDEHIERSFNEVFQAARENFEAVISVVFPGAKGSLKLTEAKPGPKPAREEGEATVDDLSEEGEAPAARGVSLEVKFANKAPRTLSLLSGGEKAMTAIAFLFSLFLARPCPFYILDEVEASLDDLNIRRFLSLVHRYRDRTQFIIITHQRQTMEVADTLYGVALQTDGTSRLLSRKMTVAKGA
jgi:chromosome segregation protein